MLELAAAAYRTFSERRSRGSGRGSRADLKALSRAIQTALETLGAITPYTAALLGVGSLLGGHNFSVGGLGKLERELSALQRSIVSALDLPPAPNRTPVELTITLGLLAAAYKRATGHPVTHTANRDGEHIGRPLSPFGRFAIAFFAEVDPSLAANKIANAIRRELPNLKRDLPTAQ
jgi:hypothetical protein